MWWSESTPLEKRQAVDKHKNLWCGLSNRFTYLESAHDLLINGFTARDVTLNDATDVTDPYATADEGAAPASVNTTPAPPHDLTEPLNIASTEDSILEASTIATYADSFNRSASAGVPEADTTATEVDTEVDTTAEATTAGAATEGEATSNNTAAAHISVGVDTASVAVPEPGCEPDIRGVRGPDTGASDTPTVGPTSSPTSVGGAADADAASPVDRTSQLLREAETLEGETGATEHEHERDHEQEPLTMIARGLQRANSLLEPSQAPARDITTKLAGQSTIMVKHRARLTEDEPLSPELEGKKHSKPAGDAVSSVMNYSAPRPSTSFNNISKIEKISDPKDPLAPNFHDITSPTLPIPPLDPDEADEVRNDKDYIPTYSGKATSDSDNSIIEIHYRGPSNVWVTASDGPRRKQNKREAKAIANAKIREALVSSQDRADSSYTHGLWVSQRRDTPQVSPSIPLNPATPSVPRAPVAFVAQSNLPSSFVPTNELVLTEPSLTRNDIALGTLMKRFEHASTSAVISQTGYRPPRPHMAPRSPLTAQPTRRSSLQTAPPPPSTFRASHYYPGYKTWRKYVDPEKEAEVTIVPRPDEEKKATRENRSDADSDSDVKII